MQDISSVLLVTSSTLAAKGFRGVIQIEAERISLAVPGCSRPEYCPAKSVSKATAMAEEISDRKDSSLLRSLSKRKIVAADSVSNAKLRSQAAVKIAETIVS